MCFIFINKVRAKDIVDNSLFKDSYKAVILSEITEEKDNNEEDYRPEHCALENFKLYTGERWEISSKVIREDHPEIRTQRKGWKSISGIVSEKNDQLFKILSKFQWGKA